MLASPLNTNLLSPQFLKPQQLLHQVGDRKRAKETFFTLVASYLVSAGSETFALGAESFLAPSTSSPRRSANFASLATTRPIPHAQGPSIPPRPRWRNDASKGAPPLSNGASTHPPLLLNSGRKQSDHQPWWSSSVTNLHPPRPPRG
jgi:hypothetical protein